MRQLTKLGRSPEFGPVKNGVPRTVDLAAETIELLKAHRRAQAEIKMRNRTAYRCGQTPAARGYWTGAAVPGNPPGRAGRPIPSRTSIRANA